MLPCLVKSRSQPRQSQPLLSVRPAFPVLESSSLALSYSLDALCSESFHQPFSNQPLPNSFLKMPGRMGFLLSDMPFDVQTFGRVDIQRTPRPIPFLFTFLRTLLHFIALRKNSSPFISSDSALFAKKPPGVGVPLHSVGNAEREDRSGH